LDILAFITIGINPNITGFSLPFIGPLMLSWHGFFGALGITSVLIWATRAAKKEGIDEDLIYGIAMWAIIGGLIGARAVHVIDSWSYYSAAPISILRIWVGGIGLMGGIFGATAAGSIYIWRHRLPLGKILDITVPGILIGQFVGRIGDIINGEHLSNFANLPWAFEYTHPDSPAYQLGPMHPAIAYEMLWDMIVFFVTYKLLGKLNPDGMVFFTYLALYGFGRFFIQFTRRDPVWIAGLQEAHFLSLGMLIIGLFVIASRARLKS
jgi:phosphatidylglycerol:prolipoprotein diacylglycerol transferase